MHFCYINLYLWDFWPPTSFWGLSPFLFWKTVWFLLWLCKLGLVNNLPQKLQTSKSWFVVSLRFQMHFYASKSPAIQRNNLYKLIFTVFTTYFWKTTVKVTQKIRFFVGETSKTGCMSKSFKIQVSIARRSNLAF